jgi:putative DNA primase/helicase
MSAGTFVQSMTARPVVPLFDDQAARTFLRLLHSPADGVIEVVGFNAQLRGSRVVSTDYRTTVAGWFDSLPHAIAAAAAFDASCYATVNPVVVDLLARSSNRLKSVKHRTKDEEVAIVRRLYIDADSARPDDVSASEDELAAALSLRDRLVECEPELAAAAAWGRSGNGGWVLANLAPLPNDQSTYELVKRALAYLASRYGAKGKASAFVDVKTCNAARVMCLPGTIKRKGDHRPERPHRIVTIERAWMATDGSATAPPPALDLAAWIEDRAPAVQATSVAPGLTLPPSPPVIASEARGENLPTGGGDRSDRVHRAGAYLARIRPAVSGQGGHDATFAAVRAVVHGFDLTPAEAWPLIETWNAACDPPWERGELEHKLNEVETVPSNRPRGWLYDTPRATNGHVIGEGRDLIAATLAEGANGSAGLAVAGSSDAPLVMPGQEANPARLARLYLADRHAHQDGLTLRYWRAEWFRWDGSSYQPTSDKDIKASVTRAISTEFERLYHQALMRHRMAAAAASPGDKPGKPPVLLPVTRAVVADTIQEIAGLTHLPAHLHPEAPMWLDGDPAPLAGWHAVDCLPTSNAIVHLPTLANASEAGSVDLSTRRPTPRLFSTWATDYPFNPSAPKPLEWLGFLDQITGSDREVIDLIQEFFGLTLTIDTSLQKALMIIGPPGGGKGTIARVLRSMLGPANVVGPTLASLGERFGLQSFIGKPVAVIDDARISGKTDQAPILEKLLTIIGEGTISVDRKHLDFWTGKLSTRLILLSNDPPAIQDASAALVRRLIVVRLTRSFADNPDRHLFDRLSRELPSILLWSIQGWARLRSRGHLIQPSSGADTVEEIREAASPVTAFVRDCCRLEEGAVTPVMDLFNSWSTWTQSNGQEHAGTVQVFCRKLRSAIPGIGSIRTKPGDGSRPRCMTGIRIRRDIDDVMASRTRSRTQNPFDGPETNLDMEAHNDSPF